jgi:hypothetical protein
MVLWYARINAIACFPTLADHPGLGEELQELPFNILTLCSTYTRPGNHHQVPSRCECPDIHCLADQSLRAVALDSTADLFADDQSEPAIVKCVVQNTHND